MVISYTIQNLNFLGGYAKNCINNLMEILINILRSEKIWFYLVCVLSSIILSILDSFIFINLFNIKTDKNRIFKAISAESFFRLIITCFVPIPYSRIISIFLVIIIYIMFYNSKVEQSILGETINSIIIVCSEIIFYKIFDYEIDNYILELYNASYKLNLTIFISLLKLVICVIVKYKKIHINISDNLQRKNKYTIIVISLICCVVTILYGIKMNYYITTFPYGIFVVDILSLITFFYISVKNVIMIDSFELQNKKIQNLELYNKLLSVSNDDIKGFRHDFFNFVQALDGYSQNNDIDGIKKMNESILKECTEINNISILKSIKNPGVCSILTNKYYLAKKENITMNIEVLIDINDIKISDYELCKILGILLDNAIEAAKECDEKIINVRFIKNINENKEIITIENSYKKLNIDIDKIFEKGYSTKNDNKDHGLGLWNVRKILNIVII